MMAPTYVWLGEPPRLEKGRGRPAWWARLLLPLFGLAAAAGCAQTIKVKVDCGPVACPDTMSVTVNQDRGQNQTTPTTALEIPLL